MVKQKVIESDWVPGVLDYLKSDTKNKTYFLVCNAGSQSAILANSMINEGFKVSHLRRGMNKFK